MGNFLFAKTSENDDTVSQTSIESLDGEEIILDDGSIQEDLIVPDDDQVVPDNDQVVPDKDRIVLVLPDPPIDIEIAEDDNEIAEDDNEIAEDDNEIAEDDNEIAEDDNEIAEDDNEIAEDDAEDDAEDGIEIAEDDNEILSDATEDEITENIQEEYDIVEMFFQSCVDIKTFTAFVQCLSEQAFDQFMNNDMVNSEGLHFGTPLTSLLDPNGFIDCNDPVELNERREMINYLLSEVDLDVKSSISSVGIEDLAFADALQTLLTYYDEGEHYTNFLRNIESSFLE
jgi:hypothetical protein